jgi:hypothetical protein
VLLLVCVCDEAASAAVVHVVRLINKINRKKMLTIKHCFLAAL